MEKIKNGVGEDNAGTDKEEVKGVRKKEVTEDKVTPQSSFFHSSPGLSTAVDLHAAPASPRKEKRKEIREMQQQQRAWKGSSDSIPRIRLQESFTAWGKKPPSKGGRKARPPRFSRLLGSLSEESMVFEQQKPELATEPSTEELEDLVSRPALQDLLTGQNEGQVVDICGLSLNEPQEIPAVETVETEPKGLEEPVASSSSGPENLAVQPSGSTESVIEPKREDSSFAPVRRAATVRSVHSKLLLSEDPVSSKSGQESFPCVWSMGQRISRWRLAHQHGYHIDQITQDKVLKSTIMKHERETKAAVPLPLQEVIEEEVLEILKETLKAYQKHIGVDHELTLKMEEQAEKLHLRLKGRGVID